ncbi:hypothetical protein KY348_06765, partial [Candidatus Woesearchaeota archaeon]|nr:hypothetical protein [Candidatus Woesearchaeota archaeon]
VVFLLAISSVAAVSIDEECQDNGFDYGIAKYDCSNGVYTLDEQNSLYDYYVFGFTGDCQEADWTASPGVDGVLVKSAADTSEDGDGTSGTVYGWTETKCNPQGVCKDITHDISHVTFCKDSNGGNGGNGCKGDCNGDHPVPVFSFATLAVAVVLAGLGLAYLRKR